MKNLEKLFRSHPRSASLRITGLPEALEALTSCIAACTVCADSCLAENNIAMMRRCIRTDLDCADICTATLRIVLRQTETVAELVRQQIHACVVACQLCAEECEQHEHEHCKLCARECRRCQEACNRLLGEMSSSGVVSPENMDEARPTIAE